MMNSPRIQGGSPGKAPARLAAAVLVALLFAFSAPTVSLAQDTHYWANQIGNRARLLGGAVVGNPGDLSAVYYNPGGLALSHRAELVLAGLGVELSSFKGSHPDIPDRELEYSSASLAPGMFAGEIPLGAESEHRFAYSVLTRYAVDLGVGTYTQLPNDATVIPEVAFLANRLTLDAQLSEYWVGGTWAYQLQPTIGVGVSTFVVVRNQSVSFGDFSQVLTADNNALVSVSDSEFSYQHWRMILKLGIAGELESWTYGLTVTSAGIGIGGTGDRYLNLTRVGQMLDLQGDPITDVAATAQRDVTAKFHSPLSVAFGVSRTFGNTVLHASGEFFAPVGEYVVVDSQPFVSQTSGETIPTAVMDEADRVFNVALGVEQIFNEGLKAYVGFHTDFSSATENPTVNLTYSQWDLYHIGGGATFNAMGTDFTVGAVAALGNSVVEREHDQTFPPVGLPNGTEMSIQRITFLLGFNFGFN
jgi:hypothetical protein